MLDARFRMAYTLYSIAIVLFRKTTTMNIDDRAPNEIIELTGVIIGELIVINARLFPVGDRNR